MRANDDTTGGERELTKEELTRLQHERIWGGSAAGARRTPAGQTPPPIKRVKMSEFPLDDDFDDQWSDSQK